ncbi:MAG: CMP/dCMP deaminase zinc-binding protein [Parcubacteria group bacterium Gr01-1014_31]|nr:MAG: CMP/dCMP deaminase zinc-binding protein [Parcubacteria group bacterium Gr01-1014_31]
MQHTQLYKKAQALTNTRTLTPECVVGEVGCALQTDRGNMYVGTSIDAACGIGFCAEQSAIASMVAGGESRITAIVAVDSNGNIVPPCGRCREMIYQVNHDNIDTEVMLAEDRMIKLADLLPERWQAIR